MITIFAEKVAGEEVIDDASTLANGDVHVIGLFAEPIQIVSSLRVFRFPWRLLWQPLLLILLFLFIAAPNTESRSECIS